MDFEYIIRNIPGPGANLDEFIVDFEGCTCAGEECLADTCHCLRFGQVNDNFSEFKLEFLV